jgi:hypothetical protein
MIGALSLLGASPDNNAMKILIGAKQIETAKIYESAEPSKLAESFKSILQRDNPRCALIELFKRSKTGAGRIYALLGLFRTDKKLYSEYVKTVESTEVIQGLWYSVVRHLSAKEWVTMIESGELYNNIMPSESKTRSK